MGSLATHLCAFVFLFPIGVRRLLCCMSLYLKSPSLFRSKPWYFSDPKWKTLDLYLLLLSLPLASFSLFFLFLSSSSSTSPASPHRFSLAHSASLLLLFWLLLASAALRDHLDLHDSLLFLLASAAFLADYSLTGYAFSGVAAQAYSLSASLTLVCAASCLALSVWPTAFCADVALSLALLFKGTWSLQSGLSLFSGPFVPRGCTKMALLPGDGKSDLHCDLNDDHIRGEVLIQLLFAVQAIGVYLLNFAAFAVLSRSRNLRGLSVSDHDSENLLMRSLPEYEME